MIGGHAAVASKVLWFGHLPDTVLLLSQNRDDIVSTGLALQRLTSDWGITVAGTQEVFAGTAIEQE